MNKTLYFLPIITEAFRQADQRTALESAFKEIASLGERPEFAEGFQRFREFLALALQGEPISAEDFMEETEALVQRLIFELSSGTFRDGCDKRQMALQLIESRQEWKTEFEEAQATLSGDPAFIGPVNIVVTADDGPVGNIVISPDTTAESLGGIAPGRYSLLLETGRMIWSGCLSLSDLVLQAAFPEEPLQAAADTAALPAHPTLVVSLLDGDAVLRVFPGFERGRIEVELTPSPRHGGKK
jgi:hypothetical protein